MGGSDGKIPRRAGYGIVPPVDLSGCRAMFRREDSAKSVIC